MPEGRIILIAGPTASGKSELALEVAERLAGEILSVDATAVYRGLDVGSAKPDAAARRRVPHHLLDVADPWESYTLGRFLADARRCLLRVRDAGRAAVLVGGTGLYARALVEGWRPPPPPDPQVRAALTRRAREEGVPALWRELRARAPDVAARLAPNDRTRVVRALERLAAGDRPSSGEGGRDPSLSLVGEVEAYVLEPEREGLARRIEARAQAQFAAGLLEETLTLLGRGVPPQAPALRSIGYRCAVAWALGRATEEEALRRTVRDTLSLARRQRTWWRSVPWARRVPPAVAHRLLLGR